MKIIKFKWVDPPGEQNPHGVCDITVKTFFGYRRTLRGNSFNWVYRGTFTPPRRGYLGKLQAFWCLQYHDYIAHKHTGMLHTYYNHLRAFNEWGWGYKDA